MRGPVCQSHPLHVQVAGGGGGGRAGNVNVGVISTSMLFKAKKLEETPSESVDGKEMSAD